MNPLLHWHETNPSFEPRPEPKPYKQDGRVRSGAKAKPIIYEGRTYKRWDEACAATGKTKDALRHAIKMAARRASA